MSFWLVKQIGQTLNSTEPPTTKSVIEIVTQAREQKSNSHIKWNSFTGSTGAGGLGFWRLLVFGADLILSPWSITLHGGGSGLILWSFGSLLQKFPNVTQYWSFYFEEKKGVILVLLELDALSGSVLEWYFHQSSKSKGCFFLCSIFVFRHDLCEVHKLQN